MNSQLRENESAPEETTDASLIQKKSPPKNNYTLKEAALYLNVSTRTIERLIKRRLIRRNKALRKILIPRFELDSFLQKTL